MLEALAEDVQPGDWVTPRTCSICPSRSSTGTCSHGWCGGTRSPRRRCRCPRRRRSEPGPRRASSRIGRAGRRGGPRRSARGPRRRRRRRRGTGSRWASADRTVPARSSANATRCPSIACSRPVDLDPQRPAGCRGRRRRRGGRGLAARQLERRLAPGGRGIGHGVDGAVERCRSGRATRRCPCRGSGGAGGCGGRRRGRPAARRGPARRRSARRWPRRRRRARRRRAAGRGCGTPRR